MKTIYFLSHPDVLINREIPITKWGLSDLGRKKMDGVLGFGWLAKIEEIYSSLETKAMEAAQIISDKLGIKSSAIEELGEIDRSSTGFLEFDKFQMAVDSFFSKPEESYKGWEKAADAQKRITNVVYNQIIKNSKAKNILIVSHGGVGALLLADLLKKKISRKYDQKSQGSYFIFKENKRLIKIWIRIK